MAGATPALLTVRCARPDEERTSLASAQWAQRKVFPVSDDILRLIPTDPDWQAPSGADEAAARHLAALLPEPATVEVVRHDEIVFVDAGANFERTACSACGDELGTDWWSEQMSRASLSNFRQRTVTTPCCRTSVDLNDLAYEWPAGFARMELSVLNPGRSWLTEAELADVSAALGRTLRQVFSHY
jgi:hypothetical protein